MLKKQHKVPLRKEKNFFTQAHTTHTRLFSLYWQPNNSELLFQVVVSKKTAKLAVERNAIKRAVFEELGKIQAEHKSKTSLVVIVKSKDILKNLASLADAITEILQKQ